MFKYFLFINLFFIIQINLHYARASECTNSEWMQCGGINFNGQKCCKVGLTCKLSSVYYSQCLKSNIPDPIIIITPPTESVPIQYGVKNMSFNLKDFISGPDITSIQNSIRVRYQPTNVGSKRLVGIIPTTSEYKNEIMLEYDILFENGFEWVKGGKLPGLRGGNKNIATTGCVTPQPKNAWSFRLMWSRNGSILLYIYDQSRNEKNIACGVVTKSNINILQINKWINFKIYMKLNSRANVKDGIAKLYINNTLILHRDQIAFSGENNITIDHVYLSTFYGGNDASWAPSKTTYIQFKNAKIYNKNIL